MNNYFIKLTEEERENILDKHKSLYDGYSIRQPQSNMQPLYTQDFANDKGGITVNSKGEVSSYNNKIFMKESKNICSECGMYEEVCECGSGKYPMEELDISDLKKGKKYKYSTPSFEDEIEFDSEYEYPEGDKMYGFKGKKMGHSMGDKHINDFVHQMDDEEFDEDIDDVQDLSGKFDYVEEKDLDEVMSEIEGDIEFDEEFEDIKESINESLNWFKKFKKYN